MKERPTHENRILELLAEGRLVRGTWADTDARGRELLCLLTALTGDPRTRPSTCPADLAPTWIAYLMPWWNDAGSEELWQDQMRQIGELAHRFGELYGETGRRALAGCQLVSLRVALRHAGEAAPAVERVIALWERVHRGDEPTNYDWWAVTQVVEEAVAAATAAAIEAPVAESAKWWTAPAAAATQAALAAVRAALAAVRAALAAVLAAEARAAIDAAAWATESAWATGSAARLVVADEVIQGHIDAIRYALGIEVGGET
jgi:hypothetical protein